MMTNSRIADILKEILNIQKEPVAVKAWKEEPQSVRKYEERAFPGMCTQIGEVLKSGETFYTNLDHQFCTGGVVATGVALPPNEEERTEMLRLHLEVSRGYRDIDTSIHYLYESEKLIPPVIGTNAAVQLGLFRDVPDPDIVLIFLTPRSADMLNRTYCYVVGEPVLGFGGNGGCPFAIQYPFVTGKPSFTYSDVAWRKYIGLAEGELTASYPYQTLVRLMEDLPAVADAYNKYGEYPE